MPLALTLFEVLVPAGYLVFAVWASYTSGYNMALMRRHRPRGVGKYGPYLTVSATFIGMAAIIFLVLDEFAYDTGFLKANLPADLSGLNFYSFLLKQFTNFHLRLSLYSLFFIGGLVISLIAAYAIIRFAFDRGKKGIENE